MLTGPWGLELARLIFNDDFREYEATEELRKTETDIDFSVDHNAIIIGRRMTKETFNRINQPVL